ncbi:MAG: transglutaminaseTgpA domain-containing protein [Candidatus Omnitrophota bacterium]
MLSLHIVIGILVTVALLSLGNQFGDLRLFAAFTFIGFATSWWQQKRNKPLPKFKIFLNLLFIGLTIRALLPFFISQPTDILTGLLKTWIYFLILHTFTVLTKRDYYFLMVLSLGLIVFSCFSEETSEIYKLRYITLYFIIWIAALRVISLLKDVKEKKEIYYQSKQWILRELKIGAIFILGTFIIAVPIFSAIPRFDIPLPFYPLVEQKYSVSYADFPKGMMSFFSPVKQQLKEPEKEPTEIRKISRKAKERLIEVQETRTKPIFWHAPEDYEDILQELRDQVRKTRGEIDRINQTLEELSKKENIPEIKQLMKERERLTYRQTELEKSVEDLEKQIRLLKEEYLKSIQAQSTALAEEAENKVLLESLKEKTKILEKSLESAAKMLISIREELNRINDKIDEVREIVFRESMEASAESQIQRMWARKEILEEKLESLEKEVKSVGEEFEELNRLVREKQVELPISHLPEEYERKLQELKKQVEEVRSELEEINKQLVLVSKEKNVPQVEKLVEESEKLTERNEMLAENLEGLQKQQEDLKEEYRRAVEEKNAALLSEPENKGLQESLEEKTRDLENELARMAKRIEALNEELKRTEGRMDEIRANVFRESMKAPAGNQIQRMWAKKEILMERLKSLTDKIENVQEEYIETKEEMPPQAEIVEPKKEIETKKELSVFDLLFGILSVLIILISVFLFYCIIAFFLPYLKEKNKLKKSFQKNNYNLCVVILYKFLCRVLNIFGYKHPIIIDPKDYLIKIIRRFENLRLDCSKLTEVFLEARYSTHKIVKQQAENTLHYYGNILEELKNAGNFWQKLILKLDFVFKLKI